MNRKKYTIEEATKFLSDALRNPVDGLHIFKKINVKLTKWQKFRMKFYMFVKNTRAAQKIILDNLK